MLKEHGIAFDEKWFGYGDFYAFPTKALMERFLAEPEGLPEAIVCINDSMAIAVCEVLSDHGYSVPDDVIVTGFDGIIQEQYNFPRLTTCRRDMKKLGAYMAELLERSLSDTPMKQEYIFPYTLDVSQSCGCRKCTMESVSRAVNAIYSRMNDSEQYDRSMKNMLTKLTFEHDSAKIHEILRYYIRSDSYLCMNSDFEDDNPPEHTYEEQPFTDVVRGTDHGDGVYCEKVADPGLEPPHRETGSGGFLFDPQSADDLRLSGSVRKSVQLCGTADAAVCADVRQLCGDVCTAGIPAQFQPAAEKNSEQNHHQLCGYGGVQR